MPCLTAVNASQNQVKVLPSCIEDIPLAELQIARNRLSAMAMTSSPTCCVGRNLLSFPRSLTYLDLSGNHLEWLPSGLAKLPALSTLILANNNIMTLARIMV